MLVPKLTLLSLLPTALGLSPQLVPGGTWTASNGEHLNAHGGGGVIKVNGTFYLIGEDKSQGSAFGDLGPNRIIEWPKVLFNDKTGKYVLWMHVNSSSYGEAKVGVATGDSVCGKCSYVRSFQPLGFQSRDVGLFKDDDRTGYLLTEDRENGVRIEKLTADYLGVASNTYLWKDHIEAPALIKQNGRYYMFGSHLSGWDPNDNVYSTSTSLTSGWSAWATFADSGSKTYSSQTNYILDYGGGNVMYMGDRWVSTNLQASTYVWLPLTISGTKVTMKSFVSWLPNLSAASVSAWGNPPEETSYESEKAAYSGGTKDVSCSGCSGGMAAGYIGGSNAGKLSFSAITSDAGGLTSIRVKYNNGDSKPRYAQATVNGGTPAKLAFEPNSGDPASSVLNVQLKAGSANTIVFEGLGGGGWGPDIDRLMVPVR